MPDCHGKAGCVQPYCLTSQQGWPVVWVRLPRICSLHGSSQRNILRSISEYRMLCSPVGKEKRRTYLGVPPVAADPLVRIERPTSSSAIVRWAPTRGEQQKRGNRGVSGQLVVRYDVDRDASPSQILVSDGGYFVHFYAPAGLPPLPKHVVFVLDVSGLMPGHKMEQLKTAMSTILEELNAGDLFSLIPFCSAVQPIYTYMFSALRKALRVSKKRAASAGGSLGTGRRRHGPIMMMLLTDGEANGRVCNTYDILRCVMARHLMSKAAIFMLAFGTDANYSYLRRLALRNSGISRRIYEAADAHLQLRSFYRQIASPLLTHVKFSYEVQQVDENSLTKARFPTLFGGSELVVAGRRVPGVRRLLCGVTSRAGRARDAVPQPAVANVTSAERLWAYLTVRQMLEHGAAAPNDTVRVRAKDIALRYSFVTSVTSLVVVKPTGTSAVNFEDPEVPRGNCLPLI
ncbi:inter-alpha-trypsin inhibitor heavy chain H4-like [Schistocerca cancellata]|uniref:inter-alpha-trypsin inhibitor heavy chain H4-like n=1 Tax=Schistocerca cancellata TaxID=274614 RepID=UPI002118ACA2|nr:inter-alpha-trypsin inhibitor heavy chain H4-like [Schistocerca cancellata]